MNALLCHSVLVVVAASVMPMSAGADKASGDRAEPLPSLLEGIDIDPKLGAQLPASLTFRDESGAAVELGSLYQPGVPIILTFNYSNCPMLCSVQLGGLVDAMQQMTWSAGKEFMVLTIGLDPTEDHRRALDTKMTYLERYDRPSADKGWRFLTGDEESIRALADAVGFNYRYLEKRNEWVHPAVIMIVSPDGQLSSYVSGVSFEPVQLRDALMIAGLGELGKATIDFILSCLHYVPPESHSRSAVSIMRWGGIAFVIFLLGALATSRKFKGKRVTPARTGAPEA